jgi:hypothetical protein
VIGSWVSDYHFRALFDRLRLVNQASGDALPGAPQRYARILIDERGKASWSAPLTLDRQPLGAPMRVQLGASEVSGWFYPFNHLPGGVVLIASEVAAGSTVSFHAAGRRHLLRR